MIIVTRCSVKTELKFDDGWKGFVPLKVRTEGDQTRDMPCDLPKMFQIIEKERNFVFKYGKSLKGNVNFQVWELGSNESGYILDQGRVERLEWIGV